MYTIASVRNFSNIHNTLQTNKYNKQNKISKIKPNIKMTLTNKKTLLNFNNWAPEVINGRCAMIGFISGKGYEVITHQNILLQPHALEAFITTVGIITVSSLITSNPEESYDSSNKPFTPTVEMLNGRMAMLGVLFTLLSNV